LCTVYLYSDPHLGHPGMAEFRGFKSVEEHDAHIISQWNKIVKNKRDLVYILGDITLETSKHYHLLDKLMGRKIVILGNHDRHQDMPELLKYVESVAGVVDYKGYILSHCPLVLSELGKYRANIHGHIHKNSLLHPKYVNVSAENIGYMPVTLEQILLMRKQKELSQDETVE